MFHIFISTVFRVALYYFTTLKKESILRVPTLFFLRKEFKSNSTKKKKKKDTSSLFLLLVFIELCEQVDDVLKVGCMEKIRTSLSAFASLNLCAMFVAWSQGIWRCTGLGQ